MFVDDGQLLPVCVDVHAAQRRVQLQNRHRKRIVDEDLQNLWRQFSVVSAHVSSDAEMNLRVATVEFFFVVADAYR